MGTDNNEILPDVYQSKRLIGTDRFLLFAIMALLVFPAWVRSGNIRQFLSPYPRIAIIIFFLFLLVPYLRGISHYHGYKLVRERIRNLSRDPIFFLGVGFVCHLYIQWWNSGKVRIFEQGSQNVMFCPPYIDWLPGAVDTNLSWDMVVWFFPAFIALLIIRHGFSKPQMIIALLWGMISNASLLAIFGLIAPILVKNYPVWLTPILPQQSVFFFSTFGYPNNAGSFFILHLGLACGLFFHYYKDRKQFLRFLLKAGILLSAIMLLLYAIHLSRGRYAILFSWVISSFFLFNLLNVSIRRKSERRQKGAVISIAAVFVMIIGLFTLYLTSKTNIRPELYSMSKPKKFIENQFNLRFWQIVAATEIWKDYPIFGIGGGSYGEYLLQYVKDPKLRDIAIHRQGKADVHNDIMQFLCEFGIIGAGLLIVVLIILVLKIKASGERQTAFVFFGLLGIFGVSIHSLIDLPFRSPPVIIAFAVTLSGFGMLRQTSETVSIENMSTPKPVKDIIHFYAILFIFIGIIAWWVLVPIREKVSRVIVHNVEQEYESKLINPEYDDITPAKSQNASPAILRSLWWAKLLYSNYKDLHLLSAKINFDLYRDATAGDEKKAKHYLKEAFRSSMTARQFTGFGDIEFVKLHTAILDALGYHLEESWCVMNLGKAYRNNIRVDLLVREYYFRRPYLIR